jgi:hypothetical protein
VTVALLSVKNTAKPKHVRASSSPSVNSFNNHYPIKTKGCKKLQPFFLPINTSFDAKSH